MTKFYSTPEARETIRGLVARGFKVTGHALKRGQILLRNEQGQFLDANNEVVTLVTCGVLAGAYKGKDVEQRETLTHTEFPGTNDAICGRVKSGHLADAYDAEEAVKPPTCPYCLARDPRFNRAS